VVPAAVLPGFLDGRDVARLFDDAEERRVALRVGADVARVLFGQRVAGRAALDGLTRVRDCLREALGLFLRRAQEVVGKPGGALSADAGSFAARWPAARRTWDTS
jgi:hypothetical protein